MDNHLRELRAHVARVNVHLRRSDERTTPTKVGRHVSYVNAHPCQMSVTGGDAEDVSGRRAQVDGHEYRADTLHGHGWPNHCPPEGVQSPAVRQGDVSVLAYRLGQTPFIIGKNWRRGSKPRCKGEGERVEQMLSLTAYEDTHSSTRKKPSQLNGLTRWH